MRHATLTSTVMKRITYGLAFPVVFGVLLLAPLPVAAETAAAQDFALDTAFTYQGRLKQAGGPATGRYDFELELYDQPVGGIFLGTVARLGHPVADGTFAVELDFGLNVFSSQEAWLEIHVREADSGSFTTLEPRQRLAAAGAVCEVNSDLVVFGNIDLKGTGGLRFRDVGNAPAAGIRFVDFSLLPDQLHLGVGAEEVLHLFPDSVSIGTTDTTNAALYIQGGADVSASGGGNAIFGPVGGKNIGIDGNEIQARNNASASSLALNFEGGDIVLGGTLDFGWELIREHVFTDNHVVSCPTGKVLLGGGCWASGGELNINGPNFASPETEWWCLAHGAGQLEVYAICANVK